MWNIWAGWCSPSQPGTLTLFHWYASEHTNVNFVTLEVLGHAVFLWTDGAG